MVGELVDADQLGDGFCRGHGLSFLLHLYGGWTVICHPPSSRRRIPANFGRAEHQQPATIRSATVAGVLCWQWPGDEGQRRGTTRLNARDFRMALRPPENPVRNWSLPVGPGWPKSLPMPPHGLTSPSLLLKPTLGSPTKPHSPTLSPSQFPKLSLPLLASIYLSTNKPFTTRSSPDITPQQEQHGCNQLGCRAKVADGRW